jgi:hypothetical protein
MRTLSTPGRRAASPWLLAGVLCAAFFALHRWEGMRQFAGYDYSPMLHLAAQLQAHRRSGADFLSPYPPVFGWGLSLAFWLAGASWRSVVDLGGAFGVLSLLSVFALWRKIAPEPLAAGLAALLGAQAFLFHGSWWYGPPAIALALVFCGALLLAERPWALALLAPLGAALLLSKANIAWPAFAFGFAHLAAPRRWGGAGRAREALACALGAFALAGLACASLDFDLPPYFRLLGSLTGRLSHPMLFTAPKTGLEWVLDYQVAGSVSLLLVSGGFLFGGARRAAVAGARRSPWLALGLLLAFLSSFALNGDNPITSLPLLAGFLLLPSELRFSRRQIAAILALWAAAAAYGVHKGVERDRALDTGYGLFFEDGASVVQNSGFFSGLTTGPRFDAFVRQASRALGRAKPKRVFFGPRVEFGYEAFSLAPPRGLPLWWDPRSAYPAADGAVLAQIVESWRRDDFQMVVLDRADVAFLPEPIVRQIMSGYCVATNLLAPGEAQEAVVLLSKKWLAAQAAGAGSPNPNLAPNAKGSP